MFWKPIVRISMLTKSHGIKLVLSLDRLHAQATQCRIYCIDRDYWAAHVTISFDYGVRLSAHASEYFCFYIGYFGIGTNFLA